MLHRRLAVLLVCIIAAPLVPAQSEPGGFQVAVARFGDHAEYSEYFLYEDDGYSAVSHSRFALEVREPVEVSDPWGRTRVAVAVASHREYLANNTIQARTDGVTHIDLTSGMGLGGGVLNASYIPPSTIGVSPNFYLYTQRYPAVFQGMELRPGDDPLEALQARLGDVLGSPLPGVEGQQYEVVDGGSWRGQPAVGLHVTTQISDVVAPEGYREGSELWFWWVEGNPFPVYAKHRSDLYRPLPGGDGHEWAWSDTWGWELQNVSRGHEKVPWGEGTGPFDQQAVWGDVDIRPTKDGLPLDGEGRHAYGLHAALAAVEDDPTLRLDEWRDAHPDGSLRLATFEAEPATTWQFAFSDDRSAYAASSTQVAPGLSVQRDRAVDEEARVQSGLETGSSIGTMPARSLTLAEADRLASFHVPRGAWSGGPTWIATGFPVGSPLQRDLVMPQHEPTLPIGMVIMEYEDPAAGTTEAVHFRPEDGSVWMHARRPYEPELPIVTPLLARFGDPAEVDANDPRQASDPSSAFRWPGDAIVATAIVTVIVAAIVAVLMRVGFIGGYAKVRTEDLLDHPMRQRLAAAIEEQPGANMRQLHSHLPEAGWSTIVYHLKTLEGHGLVSARRHGRHRRYFPVGFGRNEASRAAALALPRTRAVYEHIVSRPGIHRQALADAERVSGPAIHRHLQRLCKEGLIEARRAGRHMRYYPRD